MTVCYYHVTYAFQSESTFYICLNVKELLARNRRKIRSLSDCNGTRAHNLLVRKRTLNHLAKLAKWLCCAVNTYLYGAFDCILLSCHVRISEWIYTLYLSECQVTPCSKQAQYLSPVAVALVSNVISVFLDHLKRKKFFVSQPWWLT